MAVLVLIWVASELQDLRSRHIYLNDKGPTLQMNSPQSVTRDMQRENPGSQVPFVYSDAASQTMSPQLMFFAFAMLVAAPHLVPEVRYAIELPEAATYFPDYDPKGPENSDDGCGIFYARYLREAFEHDRDLMRSFIYRLDQQLPIESAKAWTANDGQICWFRCKLTIKQAGRVFRSGSERRTPDPWSKFEIWIEARSSDEKLEIQSAARVVDGIPQGRKSVKCFRERADQTTNLLARVGQSVCLQSDSGARARSSTVRRSSSLARFRVSVPSDWLKLSYSLAQPNVAGQKIELQSSLERPLAESIVADVPQGVQLKICMSPNINASISTELRLRADEL